MISLELTPNEVKELKEALYEKQARLEYAYQACSDRRTKKQLGLKRKTLSSMICQVENHQLKKTTP